MAEEYWKADTLSDSLRLENSIKGYLGGGGWKETMKSEKVKIEVKEYIKKYYKETLAEYNKFKLAYAGSFAIKIKKQDLWKSTKG